MRDDFAVFILTHGRADRVYTYDTLFSHGYTGKVYIVIDDEDNQEEEYRRRFSNVLQFSKSEIAEQFDVGDTSNDRRCIIYARNACFNLARENGIKYFVELDDDYISFEYRKIKNKKLIGIPIMDLDSAFSAMIDFLNESNSLTVAFAQGGDFIGGAECGNYRKGILRKCMNSFFCDVDKPFTFVGRINEDVNTYTTLGQQGKLLMTYSHAMLYQKQTQANAGGMADMYIDMGTYLKSFFSVMYSPSCVKISAMGGNHKRIHHAVNWDCCAPKILNEKWKK